MHINLRSQWPASASKVDKWCARSCFDIISLIIIYIETSIVTGTIVVAVTAAVLIPTGCNSLEHWNEL